MFLSRVQNAGRIFNILFWFSGFFSFCPPHSLELQEFIKQRQMNTDCLCFSGAWVHNGNGGFFYRGSPQQKMVLFGTSYKSLFLWHISGKFTVKITFRDPNISFFRGGWFTSLVQSYQIKPFFSWGFPNFSYFPF